MVMGCFLKVDQIGWMSKLFLRFLMHLRGYGDFFLIAEDYIWAQGKHTQKNLWYEERRHFSPKNSINPKEFMKLTDLVQ